MAEATNETSVTSSALGDFQSDFREFWIFLPNKALFFGQLLLWVTLFQFLGNSTFGYIDTPSLFHWLYNSYNAPASDDGHGNLIPFVVLGLLWFRRNELLKLEPRVWPPALALVFFAAALHVVGFMAQQPRISTMALFIGIYGLTGLCWGVGWLKTTFFPFILFAFCVPLGSLATSITFPLRLLVTQVAVGFSAVVLQADVIREGTLITNAARDYQYDVAPACSGIRSLISLFALTTIYAFVTLGAWWKRLVMMAAAVPLAIGGNVFRIVVVIVAADSFGQDAGELIEQKFGFVTFAFAIIGIMVLGYWLGDRSAKSEE